MNTTNKFGPAAAILAAEGLAYALVLPHLPVVVGENAPWWSVGVLLAAYSVSQFLVLEPISRWTRRIGVPVVVAGCLVGTAIGMVLTALSTDYWVLLAGRIIDGLSAGTVVVVTAAHLKRISSSSWAKSLGWLAAVRGGSILAGIFGAAAAGILLSDPVEALQMTAWIGASLAIFATIFVRSLGEPRESVLTSLPRLGQDTRRQMVSHVSAQGAQAALIVTAPALGLVIGDQTTSFLAPVAAILGLAFGQLFLAPKVLSWRGLPGMFALVLLMIAAGSTALSPLAGVALLGAVIGTLAPIAQAQLLRSRVEEGWDEIEANAIAGKAAIVGQILGPSISFAAMSFSALLASFAVAVFGALTLSIARVSRLKVQKATSYRAARPGE